MIITKKAYAKINLTLDVLGKRDDGYHNIISIMQTISLCDELTLKKTRGGINVSVSWDNPLPCGEDNTVYRAIKLMSETYGIEGGLAAFIKKRIPIAAGLGGGSADAAAAIEAVNELYGLNAKQADLMALGAQIGADVPFCIAKGTAVAEGIGERIMAFNGRLSCYVVLVKPHISISTKEAFAKIDDASLTRRFDTNLAIHAMKASDFRNLGQNLYNAMEIIAFPEYPFIRDIKRKIVLQGAQGALMSGSGPTVYGLFENKMLAENAYNYFKNEYIGALPTDTFFCEFYYPEGYGENQGICKG